MTLIQKFEITNPYHNLNSDLAIQLMKFSMDE